MQIELRLLFIRQSRHGWLVVSFSFCFIGYVISQIITFRCCWSFRFLYDKMAKCNPRLAISNVDPSNWPEATEVNVNWKLLQVSCQVDSLWDWFSKRFRLWKLCRIWVYSIFYSAMLMTDFTPMHVAAMAGNLLLAVSVGNIRNINWYLHYLPLFSLFCFFQL